MERPETDNFDFFPKMSDFAVFLLFLSDPRDKCRKSRFVSKNRCHPLKVLEFSGDHFDSGTARNGEFRLFPEMSDFGVF